MKRIVRSFSIGHLFPFCFNFSLGITRTKTLQRQQSTRQRLVCSIDVLLITKAQTRLGVVHLATPTNRSLRLHWLLRNQVRVEVFDHRDLLRRIGVKRCHSAYHALRRPQPTRHQDLHKTRFVQADYRLNA